MQEKDQIAIKCPFRNVQIAFVHRVAFFIKLDILIHIQLVEMEHCPAMHSCVCHLLMFFPQESGCNAIYNDIELQRICV